ncbi:unnamed protein product [Echinostoma caproni]|uniref:Dynein light chain n=1 Tax=Echinostoma caproni TaxID=27848 RepID=A0A182ZZE0_9TREM|nr:unnamed protein product [Echinostoma caproni]
MEERKALVKYTNMDNRMVEAAIETAVQALDKYQVSKEIADYIKRTFDKRYQRTWHCVVGRDFGRNGTIVREIRVIFRDASRECQMYDQNDNGVS